MENDFWKIAEKKKINFEEFYVGSTKQNVFYNGDCLENNNLKIFENEKNSKWVNKKNRVFAASRKLYSGHPKICLRHGFCRN